jgi:hypothetical protein
MSIFVASVLPYPKRATSAPPTRAISRPSYSYSLPSARKPARAKICILSERAGRSSLRRRVWGWKMLQVWRRARASQTARSGWPGETVRRTLVRRWQLERGWRRGEKHLVELQGGKRIRDGERSAIGTERDLTAMGPLKPSASSALLKNWRWEGDGVSWGKWEPASVSSPLEQ